MSILERWIGRSAGDANGGTESAAPSNLLAQGTERSTLGSTARRLVHGFPLRLHFFLVRVFTLLDVTPREKSIVILVPPLRKKEFVSLFGSIMKLGHASALFPRGLGFFHSENKTKYGLSVFGNFSLLSRFRIRRRIDMSNEMPAVFVGLVHLHDSVFIEEGLLFFGKLVCLTGTNRYEGGRAYQQQFEGLFIHGERSGRYQISFRLFDAVPMSEKSTNTR